ncbi:MAG: response regulator [Veillonellaceae bacterium]|nr:response regulator [Veillonellaceae bacterium]
MAKILIVDDNEQNCELMRDVISSWGYEVDKVFQGMDALEYARSTPPHLILLDVMLPGMNGFEVCRELKRNPKTEYIPVIMLTALNDVEDRIRGFKVGASSFISKPPNYNELKYVISSCLQRKQVFDSMESRRPLCNAFLVLMRAKDELLYQQAIQRSQLCEKVGRLLGLLETQLDRLVAAACLCEIGAVIRPLTDPDHVVVGEDIVRPLKMGEWLTLFVRWHHTKVNSPDFPRDAAAEQDVLPELRIMNTVNRFLELRQNHADKDECLSILRDEARTGEWDAKTVEALLQLRKDETFIQAMQYGR